MTRPLYSNRIKLPVTPEIRDQVVERIILGDSIKQAVTWAKNELGVVIGVSTVVGWPEYNEARKAKDALRNQAAREAVESTLCQNVNDINGHMRQLVGERVDLVSKLGLFKVETQEYSRIRQAIKAIDAAYSEYFNQYNKILAITRNTTTELSENQQTAAIEDVFAELDLKLAEQDEIGESEESN